MKSFFIQCIKAWVYAFCFLISTTPGSFGKIQPQDHLPNIVTQDDNSCITNTTEPLELRQKKALIEPINFSDTLGKILKSKLLLSAVLISLATLMQDPSSIQFDASGGIKTAFLQYLRYWATTIAHESGHLFVNYLNTGKLGYLYLGGHYKNGKENNGINLGNNVTLLGIDAGKATARINRLSGDKTSSSFIIRMQQAAEILAGPFVGLVMNSTIKYIADEPQLTMDYFDLTQLINLLPDQNHLDGTMLMSQVFNRPDMVLNMKYSKPLLGLIYLTKAFIDNKCLAYLSINQLPLFCQKLSMAIGVSLFNHTTAGIVHIPAS